MVHFTPGELLTLHYWQLRGGWIMLCKVLAYWRAVNYPLLVAMLLIWSSGSLGRIAFSPLTTPLPVATRGKARSPLVASRRWQALQYSSRMPWSHGGIPLPHTTLTFSCPDLFSPSPSHSFPSPPLACPYYRPLPLHLPLPPLHERACASTVNASACSLADARDWESSSSR